MFKHKKSSSSSQLLDVKTSSAGPATSSDPPGDKRNLSSDAIAAQRETISADSNPNSKPGSKPGIDSKIHDSASLDVDPHKKLLPRKKPWLAKEMAKARTEYENMTAEEKARASKFLMLLKSRKSFVSSLTNIIYQQSPTMKYPLRSP